MASERRLMIQILLAAILVAGCLHTTSSIKPTSIAESQIEENYPQSAFISAWGQSSTSYREAELNARAMVSEQISSRLESETVSYAEAVMRDSEVSDYQRLTSTVKSRTEFTRAELIRFDSKSRHPRHGQYYVFAFASRRELIDVLTADYQDHAQVFRHHLELHAILHSDLAAYTQSWRRAYRAYTEMASTACAIQAISRSPFIPFQESRDEMRQLDRDRISLLASTQVYVRISSHSELDQNSLSESITGALMRLGLSARTGLCPGDGLQLELSPMIKWRRIMVDICEVTLSGPLSDCSSASKLIDVSLSGPELCGQGRDPIGNLYRQATPEALVPILRKSLEYVFPFDE